MADEPNSNEGADPTDATIDNGKPDDADKTQKLAKAGRKDFDPNAGQE